MAGCVVAGTQLATHHTGLKKELKAQKLKLIAKVTAAIEIIAEHTGVLHGLTSSDVAMVGIDRGADRFLAAYDDQLEAIERSFDHASIVPLTDKEQARLADASLVRARVLPKGTTFVTLEHKQQWAHMNAMRKALTAPDVAAAVKRLGLELETERLRRWVDLYGAKLGLTELQEADPAVTAVQSWHDAYAALFVHVLSEYDDPKSATHAKIREALLSPYNQQADEERRIEQKAKARRNKADAPAGDDA